MGNERGDHELEVFRHFVVVAGLSPSSDCGEKRPRPEPDILFENAVGERTAFELVELLDQEYQNRIGLLFGTKAALQAHYENLLPEKRQEFLRKFGNALLYFRFSAALTFKRRKSIFGAMFDQLLLLPDGYEGEALEDNPNWVGVLEGVTISRGRFVGPIFDPESIGWIGDPTVVAIQRKLGKTYVTDHPIELLAHIETNPMFPDEVWMADLEEFFAGQDKPLRFRRIWVFDVQRGEIKFKFPRQ